MDDVHFMTGYTEFCTNEKSNSNCYYYVLCLNTWMFRTMWFICTCVDDKAYMLISKQIFCYVLFCIVTKDCPKTIHDLWQEIKQRRVVHVSLSPRALPQTCVMAGREGVTTGRPRELWRDVYENEAIWLTTGIPQSWDVHTVTSGLLKLGCTHCKKWFTKAGTCDLQQHIF